MKHLHHISAEIYIQINISQTVRCIVPVALGFLYSFVVIVYMATKESVREATVSTVEVFFHQ